jgi:hypothetical protein
MSSPLTALPFRQLVNDSGLTAVPSGTEMLIASNKVSRLGCSTSESTSIDLGKLREFESELESRSNTSVRRKIAITLLLDFVPSIVNCAGQIVARWVEMNRSKHLL